METINHGLVAGKHYRPNALALEVYFDNEASRKLWRGSMQAWMGKGTYLEFTNAQLVKGNRLWLQFRGISRLLEKARVAHVVLENGWWKHDIIVDHVVEFSGNFDNAKILFECWEDRMDRFQRRISEIKDVRI